MKRGEVSTAARDRLARGHQPVAAGRTVSVAAADRRGCVASPSAALDLRQTIARLAGRGRSFGAAKRPLSRFAVDR
jgi:hypothetical protein